MLILTIEYSLWLLSYIVLLTTHFQTKLKIKRMLSRSRQRHVFKMCVYFILWWNKKTDLFVIIEFPLRLLIYSVLLAIRQKRKSKTLTTVDKDKDIYIYIHIRQHILIAYYWVSTTITYLHCLTYHILQKRKFKQQSRKAENLDSELRTLTYLHVAVNQVELIFVSHLHFV